MGRSRGCSRYGYEHGSLEPLTGLICLPEGWNPPDSAWRDYSGTAIRDKPMMYGFSRQLISDRIRHRFRYEDLPSFEYLQRLMKRYHMENLVNIRPSDFKRRIDDFLRLHDYAMEGFVDP